MDKTFKTNKKKHNFFGGNKIALKQYLYDWIRYFWLAIVDILTTDNTEKY